MQKTHVVVRFLTFIMLKFFIQLKANDYMDYELVITALIFIMQIKNKIDSARRIPHTDTLLRLNLCRHHPECGPTTYQSMGLYHLHSAGLLCLTIGVSILHVVSIMCTATFKQFDVCQTLFHSSI
jgi:hypothetical protein